MIYTFMCTNTECRDDKGERTIVEAELSIKEDMRALHPPCTSCGDPCDYHWVPSVPQIVFKDGMSGWPSKGNRFKQYRNKQSEIVAKRQLDRYGAPKKALPNYQGEETGTWEEAKSQAIKDKGLDADIPAFDAKIAEVKKDKLII